MQNPNQYKTPPSSGSRQDPSSCQSYSAAHTFEVYSMSRNIRRSVTSILPVLINITLSSLLFREVLTEIFLQLPTMPRRNIAVIVRMKENVTAFHEQGNARVLMCIPIMAFGLCISIPASYLIPSIVTNCVFPPILTFANVLSL